MSCWTMETLTVVAILAVIATRGSTEQYRPAKSGVNRSGFQRSDGLSLNDWCVKGEVGLQCETVNGAECVDDRPGVAFPWLHVCKCSNSFEEYNTIIGGVARCRTKSTAANRLTDVSCQIAEDCSQFYPTAICNVGAGARSGKCGCPVDFVLDTANQRVCKPFECATESDCQSAFSPDSICSKAGGKPTCVCKGNYYQNAASSNVNSGKPACTDFKQYVCDSTNRPCPAFSGLVCNPATSRCTCQTGFALVAVPSSAAECRAYTPEIGGTCSVDSECPANAECLSFASLGRKVCMCKAYFRTSPNDKKTCQSILGRCCKFDTDCSVAKLPVLSGGIVGGALKCVKSSYSAESKGNCACDGGKSWDWNSVNSANVITPACTSTACV